jgi:hypothetical protein
MLVYLGFRSGSVLRAWLLNYDGCRFKSADRMPAMLPPVALIAPLRCLDASAFQMVFWIQ